MKGKIKFALMLSGEGDKLSDLGKYEEAIESYKKAIAIDSDDGYFYNGTGDALFQLGKYEEAIESYKKAITINEKYSFSEYKEAMLAYKSKGIIPADFKLINKIQNPYAGLGLSMHRLGKYKEAIKAYDKVLEIDSINQSALRFKKIALSELDTAGKLKMNLLDKKCASESIVSPIPSEHPNMLNDYKLTDDLIKAVKLEGATDEDINWWWRLSEQERIDVIIINRKQAFNAFTQFHKLGMSEREACNQVLKRLIHYEKYPIDNNYINVTLKNISKADYPLPWELSNRLGKYVSNRLIIEGKDNFKAEIDIYSSANAFLRQKIKEGKI